MAAATNTLRHRYPCIRIAIFHGGGVCRGEVSISCKNKTRSILIPRGLQKLLLQYVHVIGLQSGVIFRTRTGKPMNRSNIWAAMKRLCAQAKVIPDKVFPHNLRKSFLPGHFIVWKKTLQSWRVFSVTAASIQHVSTSCPPAQNSAVGWSGWDCWPCLQHNFSYVVKAAGLRVCDFCKYTESPPKRAQKGAPMKTACSLAVLTALF